jgi:hypothetical protein
MSEVTRAPPQADNNRSVEVVVLAVAVVVDIGTIE